MADPDKSRWRRDAQARLEQQRPEEKVLTDFLDIVWYLAFTVYPYAVEANKKPKAPTPEQNAMAQRIWTDIENLRHNPETGTLKEAGGAPDRTDYNGKIERLRGLLSFYPNGWRQRAEKRTEKMRREREAAAATEAEAEADADADDDADDAAVVAALDQAARERREQGRENNEAEQNREDQRRARQQQQVAVANTAERKKRDDALAAVEEAINKHDEAVRAQDSYTVRELKAPKSADPLPKASAYARVIESLSKPPANAAKQTPPAKPKKAAKPNDTKHQGTRSTTELAKKANAAKKRAAAAAAKAGRYEGTLLEITNEHLRERGVPSLSEEQLGDLVREWNEITTNNKGYNCTDPWPTDKPLQVSGGLSKKQLENCYHQDPHTEFARPAGYELLYKHVDGSTATTKWPDRYGSERLTERDKTDPEHAERFNSAEKGSVYACRGREPTQARFPNYAMQSLADPGEDSAGDPWTVEKKNWGLSPGRSDQSFYWSAFAQFFTTTHERVIKNAHLQYGRFKRGNNGRTVDTEGVEQAVEAMQLANADGATDAQKKDAEDKKREAFWVNSGDYTTMQEYLDDFDFNVAPAEYINRYDQANKLKTFLGNGKGHEAWLRFVDWHRFVESENRESIKRVDPGPLDRSDPTRVPFPNYEETGTDDTDDDDACQKLYVSHVDLVNMIFNDPDNPAPTEAGRNFENSVPVKSTSSYLYKETIEACSKLIDAINRVPGAENEPTARKKMAVAMFGEAAAMAVSLYPWLAWELDVPMGNKEQILAGLQRKLEKDQAEQAAQKNFEAWIAKARKRHDLALRIMGGFCLPEPGGDKDEIRDWGKKLIDAFWLVMKRDFYPVWRRRNERLIKADGTDVERGLGRIEGLFKSKWGIEWFDDKHFDEFDAYGYLKWQKSKPAPDHFDSAHRKAMSPDLYTLMKRRYTDEMLEDEVREAKDEERLLDLNDDEYRALFEPNGTYHPLGADQNDTAERRAYGAGAYRPDATRNARDFGRARGPWIAVPGAKPDKRGDYNNCDGPGPKQKARAKPGSKPKPPPKPKRPPALNKGSSKKKKKKPQPTQPTQSTDGEESDEEGTDRSDSDESDGPEHDGSEEGDDDPDPSSPMDVEGEEEEEEGEKKLVLTPEEEEILRSALDRLHSPGVRLLLKTLLPAHKDNIDALLRRMEKMVKAATESAIEQSEDNAVWQEKADIERATSDSVASEQERAERAAAAEAERQRQPNWMRKRKLVQPASSSKAPRPPPFPRGGPGGASSSTSARFSVSAGFGPRFQTTLRRRLNAAMRRPPW